MIVPPHIILLDLETSPSLGWVWGMYDQNVIAVKDDWFILSFSIRRLDTWKNCPIITRCLPDYPKTYARDKNNDKSLVKELWECIDAADIIIAHNGDRFDIRKANARFIYHKLGPPDPYKTVDTLKIARKHFKFDSNRLDDLAHYLGVGRKLPHEGKHTWLGCMSGDKKAWDVMRRYNAHDLELLEGVYMKLRAWSTTHVNLNNFTKAGVCPTCQGTKLVHKGWNYTKTGKRKKYWCKACGAWSSGLKHLREAA
jgi:hypothetical protein